MKKIFFSLAALGLVSVACSDTKKETPAEGNQTEQPATETSNTPDNTETTAEVKLNPPHGQPGHRCDIKVGEPLDSAPAQNNSSMPAQPANNSNSTGQGFLNSNNNAAPAQPAAQQQAQTTAPGMKGKPNPAHGQPGHRCDIKVGEPLP